MAICIVNNKVELKEKHGYTCACIYFNHIGDEKNYQAVIAVKVSEEGEDEWRHILQEFEKGTEEYNLFVKMVSRGHNNIAYFSNKSNVQTYTFGHCRFEMVDGYPKMLFDTWCYFEYRTCMDLDSEDMSKALISGETYDFHLIDADISIEDNMFTISYLVCVNNIRNKTCILKEKFKMGSYEFNTMLENFYLEGCDVTVIDESDYHHDAGSAIFIKKDDGWHIDMDSILWGIRTSDLEE